MAALDLKESELISWLNLLTESNEGQIYVINLYHTYRLSLADDDVIREFLITCISKKPTTAVAALDGFKNTCKDGSNFFALHQINPTSLDATKTLSTTMNSRTFHQFVLGRSSSVVKSVLPPEPKSRNIADENYYKNKLKRTISLKKWYNASGALGKPFPDPRHVWCADGDLVDDEIRTSSRRGPDGSKVRDALGLIDTKRDTYLLSLKFSAGHLHSLAGLEMARPTFSDNGNRRFAVYINREAEPIYTDGWGQTVHLAKLREGLSKINGLPERICSPIQLSHIGDELSVSPTGWVDVTYDADDEAFIDKLLDTKTLEDIKKQLTRVATKP